MDLNKLEPETENCQSLAAAWALWRGEKLMPRRSEMRLEEITEILPWIALVDVFSATEISFRLAGTMIREILGIELTGRNLLELTEPEHRASRGARTLQTATQPCGAIWIWEIAFAGRLSRPVEILSLPLQPNREGRPPQMLNVFGLFDSKIRPLAIDRFQELAATEQHSFIDVGAGVPEPL
jgi:hypothetical protein